MNIIPKKPENTHENTFVNLYRDYNGHYSGTIYSKKNQYHNIPDHIICTHFFNQINDTK